MMIWWKSVLQWFVRKVFATELREAWVAGQTLGRQLERDGAHLLSMAAADARAEAEHLAAKAIADAGRIWPPTPDLAERATLAPLDENDAPMNPPVPLPITPKADDPASTPPGVIL